MTFAPARAVAATPSRQAASSLRNSSPIATPPSGANAMPASVVRRDAGRESTNVSIAAVSQGSGSSAWRHRTMPDLPELEPPFTTITWVVTRTR